MHKIENCNSDTNIIKRIVTQCPTDITLKLDQVIRLLQQTLLAQQMNMLSDQRILSFNVNGETIHMALPDAQCDFIHHTCICSTDFDTNFLVYIEAVDLYVAFPFFPRGDASSKDFGKAKSC